MGGEEKMALNVFKTNLYAHVLPEGLLCLSWSVSTLGPIRDMGRLQRPD